MLKIAILYLVVCSTSVAEIEIVRSWGANTVDWIALPSGSKWVEWEGVDSTPGEIRRFRKKNIRFDIGFMAIVFYDPDWKTDYTWRKTVNWYKEQYSEHGHLMIVTLKNDGSLSIGFPKLSVTFFMNRVKISEAEEVVNIASTFDPVRFRGRLESVENYSNKAVDSMGTKAPIESP